MAAPSIVQHASNALSTPGTTLGVTWPGATTLGNRLMLFLVVNANQVTTNIVSVPAGYVLVNPPGKVIRLVTGNEQLDVWVYEKRNAASESGTKTVTIDQSCYMNAALVAVSGDDNAVAASVIQASATGAGQTALPSGTTSATTVAASLAFAFFNTGNKDAQSNLLPSGYSIVESMTSGLPSSGAKVVSTLASQTLSSTGTQSASIDVAGGFNHSYANLIVCVPSTSGGGGGGPTPPAGWDDGRVWQAVSLHYFGGSLDTATTPQLNTIADRCKLMCGFAIVGGSNNYGTKALTLLARNAGLLLFPYNKSAVRASTDPTTFPEAYWAHTCAGARFSSGSAGLQTMQPDGVGTFNDPRAFTSHSWRDWKQGDAWKVVDAFHAVYPAALAGVYLDSLFSASYKSGTNCNPATSTVYTKPQWISLIWTIADAVLNARPTFYTLANGLGGASSYYQADTATSIPSRRMLSENHVHGGLVEGWLRSNYDLWGVWPSLTEWQQCVTMMLDAQLTLGKFIWTVSNIANDTSGNPPGGWVPYTPAQINQWRRFCVGTHLLGQRGKAVFEFVSAAPTTKPWDETHAYYDVALGAPSITSGVLSDMAVVNGLYARTFASGVVIVNPSTTDPLPFVVGANYKDTETGAIYLNGSTITVPSHDAKILTAFTPGGGNPDAPVVVLLTPVAGQTLLATQSCTVTATASDADGIATVVASIDGTLQTTMILLGGVYTCDFGILQPGNHVVQVTATDANGAPLSTTASVTINVQAQSTGGDSGNSSGDSLVLGTDFLAVDQRLKDRGL